MYGKKNNDGVSDENREEYLSDNQFWEDEVKDQLSRMAITTANEFMSSCVNKIFMSKFKQVAYNSYNIRW